MQITASHSQHNLTRLPVPTWQPTTAALLGMGLQSAHPLSAEVAPASLSGLRHLVACMTRAFSTS